ncbi:MAG: hypothetical protein JNL79_11015 [Myxococcales bacterium]|nr:hypothetical protein [Myxococcales bacterium]
MNRRSALTSAFVAATFSLGALSGCAAQHTDPVDDGVEVEGEFVQGGFVIAGAAELATTVGAAGTAIVCNVVCVTVAVVAVVGTTITVAYFSTRDREQVPPAKASKVRLNLDWNNAGAVCPAVSPRALTFLSDRYTRCLAGRGGLGACQTRTYAEAEKVQACESSGGGATCATDAYVTSSSTSCPRNESFSPERTDDASGCTDKKGALRCKSARHYPCDGVHTHGTLSYNEVRSGKCVAVKKKAVRCDGAFTVGGACVGSTVECGAGGPYTSGTWPY